MNKSPQKLGLSLKPFVKKVFSVVVVFIVSWSVVYPLSAWGSIVPITVEVDALKNSSKGWDVGFGYPDIAICIESGYGSQCLPEGSEIIYVKTAQCENSLTCKFSAKIPNDEFKIAVIDVDLILNDVISSGFCEQGKLCDLGKARVNIGKPEYKSLKERWE
ncbi:hypothetical protein HW132_17570 [Brasilonema sp. CT11]|nr:hypothetical protein [Brasilonema sp. CT11]